MKVNIFVLDKDPVTAARTQCDKHVVKMIVESGQMLSTTHRVLDGVEYIDRTRNGRRIKRWRLPDNREQFLYKGSFVNHPCTKWTIENSANYDWHTTHALALCYEYTARYGKTHKSQSLIEFVRNKRPDNMPISDELTAFAQAMPDEHKVVGDAVQAYRNYYIGEKLRFATWKDPQKKPCWISENTPQVS